jgi:nucleoside-diphosphate-sugar epimerase
MSIHKRMLEHFSTRHGTPVAILRLNYAIDTRYGVLLDIARKVRSGDPVPVTMGYVNVIWQGDANRIAIETLPHADNPPFILNVTGRETLSVRDIAGRFARRFGVEALFQGTEASDALLSDTTRMHTAFAPPETTLDEMIHLIAEWIDAGGRTLGKPTHFETRDGNF